MCLIPVGAIRHITLNVSSVVFLCLWQANSSIVYWKLLFVPYSGKTQLVYYWGHCTFLKKKKVKAFMALYHYLMYFQPEMQRLSGPWSNITEFSDTHYYIYNSCFVILYLCEMIPLKDSLAHKQSVMYDIIPLFWLIIYDCPDCSNLLIILIIFVLQ